MQILKMGVLWERASLASLPQFISPINQISIRRGDKEEGRGDI